jgi:hypothetical protein
LILLFTARARHYERRRVSSTAKHTMTAQRQHSSLKTLFHGLAEEDAEELAERLDFGDDESVLAWLVHKYPKNIRRVVEAQRWPEFICLLRQVYEDDQR